ncbi:threonine-phosphate decarboxylase [Rhizobiales bacterium]|uniref:threonine-phosphate decarboxylase CobD n=1 Tax=Hongsoonwoonella zoysiae TaxID=2821844 RepID=UPI00156167AC|nr:threonine-phosphate decarboxylase CobD [Hongsoonwoonella zoysiae]NRG18626.1 threonine-phosphate decarboxylase [Hongsoonwoonella zoysiae]
MEHGGDLGAAMRRHGGTIEDWLDLSTGINPHAYPLPHDIAHHVWHRLPSEDDLDQLLKAGRRTYGVPANIGLTTAPGTQSLLGWLPRLLPDGDVAVVSPTYSSHAESWRGAGRTVVEAASPYSLPDGCRIAVIVNPNNPDGRLTDVGSLLHLARELGGRGGCLIVDEAFADCVPGASVLPHLANEPVLVLRSFGKFFGLAGLRLGFLAGPRNITEALSASLESWAVSGPAIAIGTRALSDKEWQAKAFSTLAEEIADLNIALHECGLTVFGGTPLFALAAHEKAEALHEALAKRRIWTRKFAYAPTWLRFGLPGSRANLERLTAGLQEALADI